MAAQRAKRVTINDIAQMAGTSKTTVSFYLNGKTERMSKETKERIRAAIEQTGYSPNPLARSMNAKSTSLIGVIIGEVTSTFSNRIVKGIQATARKNGYRIIIGASGYDQEEESTYVDRMLAIGMDGFLVQPTSNSAQLAEQVATAGKPLVFFDSRHYESDQHWVKTDNYEATRAAIRTCVERGYQRFILVAANEHLLSSRVERGKGFEDALAQEAKDFLRYTVSEKGVDVEDLHAFLEEHIDGETPTLVFAPNCWALPDVYVTMRDWYPLMPERVGLLGFDNVEWASVAAPAVSVIEQPAFEEGSHACQILLDVLKNQPDQPYQQTLPCFVAWRETTL